MFYEVIIYNFFSYRIIYYQNLCVVKKMIFIVTWYSCFICNSSILRRAWIENLRLFTTLNTQNLLIKIILKDNTFYNLSLRECCSIFVNVSSYIIDMIISLSLFFSPIHLLSGKNTITNYLLFKLLSLGFTIINFQI